MIISIINVWKLSALGCAMSRRKTNTSGDAPELRGISLVAILSYWIFGSSLCLRIWMYNCAKLKKIYQYCSTIIIITGVRNLQNHLRVSLLREERFPSCAIWVLDYQVGVVRLRDPDKGNLIMHVHRPWTCCGQRSIVGGCLQQRIWPAVVPFLFWMKPLLLGLPFT